MAFASANSAPIRFSTDDIPLPIRAATWRDVHCWAMRAEAEALSAHPYLTVCLRSFPDLKVVTTHTSAMRLKRTPAQAAERLDEFRLGINLAGPETLHQCGREVALDAGGSVLISSTESGDVTRASPGSSLGLHIPYASLAPLVANVRDAVMRPMPRDGQALRLLKVYVGALENEGAISTPELARLAVAHVHDLVALVIGATRDAADAAEGRGVRAARLYAIKLDIDANLGRDITIDALSLRHRLQPRYIQRLFECQGSTFTEYLLGRRLARAKQLLTDPGNFDRRIAAIAFSCGFGDLSYFNRCFRRVYGSTPSCVRSARSADPRPSRA